MALGMQGVDSAGEIRVVFPGRNGPLEVDRNVLQKTGENGVSHTAFDAHDNSDRWALVVLCRVAGWSLQVRRGMGA
ncbi:MAG: hypothetical protein Ct9H300mP1_32040 [Planctomycetaceae bacterium]|nr:MAG: hypothetical protein Ct9H300mP1_32040 [Planctomycetaceae bacterium]